VLMLDIRCEVRNLRCMHELHLCARKENPGQTMLAIAHHQIDLIAYYPSQNGNAEAVNFANTL
jgi:hypothetical protein